MLNRKYLAIALIAGLVGNQVCFASPNQQTQVGRYLILANKPLPEQKDLMLQTVQVRFPPDVKTVGEAIQYILLPSGYTLAAGNKLSLEVLKMFSFGLPLVDRNFGPMTLQEALKTLAGDSFVLRIDRENRQVSFHSIAHTTMKS